MCTYSLVIDHYWPKPNDYWTPGTIEKFKQDLKKAEDLDKLLDQKDCVDPEKAKLLDKIAELEKQLQTKNKKKLQVGQKDDKNRVFLGWRLYYFITDTKSFLITSKDEINNYKRQLKNQRIESVIRQPYSVSYSCPTFKILKIFRKENKYRKALRELMGLIEMIYGKDKINFEPFETLINTTTDGKST